MSAPIGDRRGRFGRMDGPDVSPRTDPRIARASPASAAAASCGSPRRRWRPARRRQARVVEAERAERRPLAELGQEPSDARRWRRRRRSRRPRWATPTPQRDPDQRQLAVADAAVEVEHLGQDGGERRPVGSRPRVPSACPSACTSPTPVPLAWPTPARCEAISICERASRSVPSATARGSHVADRPDHAERRSPRRTGSGWPTAATRASGSSRRCRSRPSRPAAGRRSAPGRGSSRRGRQRRMADVALAPGRLVGDDAERCWSRRRSRRSSGRRRPARRG